MSRDHSEPPEFFISHPIHVTEMTIPSSDLKHYITDSELDRLGEMTKDFCREIFWSCLGAFLGSLVPAIDAVGKFNDKIAPMGISGLIQCIICSVAFSLMTFSGLMMWQKGRNRGDLVTDIKARPRVRIH